MKENQNKYDSLSFENARHEVKYYLASTDTCYVEEYLMLSSLGFKKVYADRIVHSLYFDTHDLAAYGDNLAGVGYRTKFRLRWYNTDTTKVMAEVKIKRNQLGWKMQQPLALPEPIETLPFAELVKFLEEHLNDDMMVQFKENLFPVLMNHYHRQYYASNDGNIRVTIDDRLFYYEQHLHRKMNNEYMFPAFDGAILECKYDVGHEDKAKVILEYLPFRQSKSSKYVMGVQSSVLSY